MTTESTENISLFGEDFPIANKHDGLITIAELQDYLPSMEPELFDQLKSDIETNGIHDPILFYEPEEGKKLVIEGHTRLKAAIELGKTGKSVPKVKVAEDFSSLNDIKLWMLRHQFQRRNLSAPQKLRLAMAHKDTIEARAKENLSKAGEKIRVNQKIDTAQEIGNMAGVSRETAKRYIKVYENGTPELLDELDNGKVSIFSASYRVKSDKKEQTNKPVPKIVDDYDSALNILDKGEVIAVIVIKNEEVIKNFLPALYKKYVFYIKKD
ncbi:MAG: ParB N-terminal domain-containing protein [Mariniphaga sp.]|nr:ParB N-terminal domain-containing protein [Mariniphaga sp.]